MITLDELKVEEPKFMKVENMKELDTLWAEIQDRSSYLVELRSSVACAKTDLVTAVNVHARKVQVAENKLAKPGKQKAPNDPSVPSKKKKKDQISGAVYDLKTNDQNVLPVPALGVNCGSK